MMNTLPSLRTETPRALEATHLGNGGRSRLAPGKKKMRWAGRREKGKEGNEPGSHFPGKLGLGPTPMPSRQALSLRVLQKAGATHNPSGLSRVGGRLETEEALGELFGKVKSS